MTRAGIFAVDLENFIPNKGEKQPNNCKWLDFSLICVMMSSLKKYKIIQKIF